MINLPKITVSHNHNKVFSYLMHISICAPYVWVATTLKQYIFIIFLTGYIIMKKDIHFSDKAIIVFYTTASYYASVTI